MKVESNNADAELSGIPPMISLDRVKDESTADETFSDDEASADQSDAEDSIKSHSTNASTRRLLMQAQRRVKRQSVYEEVKALRAEVSQYKTSIEFTMRKNQDLKDARGNLEQQLAQAIEAIQSFKLKEQRWNEEMAEREVHYMNQLNDVCSDAEKKERQLMDEIIKRDVKIVELQNIANDEEVKRMRASASKEQRVTVTRIETHAVEEIDLDDESWSDENTHCSCDFI